MRQKLSSVKGSTTILYLVIITLIISVYVYVVIMPIVYAEPIKHIGIDFSDVCRSMDELNGTNPCFDESFVKTLFPEQKLKKDYQNMFNNLADTDKTPYQLNNAINNHRLACIQKDYCNIFELNPNQKIIYWYDISSKERDYLDHVIRIDPNVLHANLDKSKDDIVFQNNQRFLSFEINQLSIQSCRLVSYSPEFLPFELGYIIRYISNNCVNVSDLGKLAKPYTSELNISEIDVSKSPNWLELRYWESLKEKYKGYMIGAD